MIINNIEINTFIINYIYQFIAADSGGGLVINNTLFGIVSYGFISCEQNYPVIFTKVFHYIDWINSIIKV